MLPNIEIGPSTSVLDIEKWLGRLEPESGNSKRQKLRINIGHQDHLLADIWAAILCGTVCRQTPTDIVYTVPNDGDPADLLFETSLAGLTGASIAESIRRRLGPSLDTEELKRRLMFDRAGLVMSDSDNSQLLVEFDPRYPVSALFLNSDGTPARPPARRRLFEKQVIQFRQLLDLGALRRGSGPVGDGPGGDVGQFLAELHENGLEHGSRGTNGALPGTRYLRLRTHSAGDRAELLERCGPFRPLQRYVRETFHKSGSASLIEAAISDFGLGIVDGFQSSSARFGPDADRHKLLEELIYGRLTSKSSDASAGFGIQYALKAASNMQAFVSLRTAEFWLTVSFLPNNDKARLVHLRPGKHPHVAGTHWQIFWPHP